jgi:hypothetical protein
MIFSLSKSIQSKCPIPHTIILHLYIFNLYIIYPHLYLNLTLFSLISLHILSLLNYGCGPGGLVGIATG